MVIPLLVAAGVLGDAVNYQIGYRVGPRVFYSEGSRWLNKRHLTRAETFCEKDGGKTDHSEVCPVRGWDRAHEVPALLRFQPPLAWVTVFSVTGNLFGKIPTIKRNFQYVINHATRYREPVGKSARFTAAAYALESSSCSARATRTGSMRRSLARPVFVLSSIKVGKSNTKNSAPSSLIDSLWGTSSSKPRPPRHPRAAE